MRSNSELKSCKNCGGRPIVKHRKGKVYLECNGDCWNQTKKHDSLMEAIDEWNSMNDSEVLNDG